MINNTVKNGATNPKKGVASAPTPLLSLLLKTQLNSSHVRPYVSSSLSSLPLITPPLRGCAATAFPLASRVISLHFPPFFFFLWLFCLFCFNSPIVWFTSSPDYESSGIILEFDLLSNTLLHVDFFFCLSSLLLFSCSGRC